MAIKSRLRLNQINDEVEDFAVASVSFADASSASADFHQVMMNIAQMIENRFGLEQTAGTQANVFNVAHDLGRVAHFGSGVAADLIIRHEAANNGIDIDSAENIEIDAAAALSMNAGAASDLTVTAGGLTILSTGDAASFTVASDAAGEDLTIELTGSNDASVLIKSAGTGADAISLESSAGGIKVGSTLAASQSIDIGESAQNRLLMTRGAGAAQNTVKLLSLGTSVYDPGNTDAAVQLESGGSIALVSSNTSTMSAVVASSGGFQAYAQGSGAQNWALSTTAIAAGQEAMMFLESSSDIWMGSSSSTGGEGNMVMEAGGGARTSAELATLVTNAEAALAGSGRTYGVSSLQDVIDMVYADVGTAGTDTVDCLWLNDANRSGWSVNSGIPLSFVQEDWTEFESAYGEVSLLRGIIKAGVGASDKFYFEATVADPILEADGNIFTTMSDVSVVDETGAAVNAAPTIDATTSLAELQDRIEVYVNGQRMALNGDCTPTIVSGALSLAFDFDLEIGDVIICKA